MEKITAIGIDNLQEWSRRQKIRLLRSNAQSCSCWVLTNIN